MKHFNSWQQYVFTLAIGSLAMIGITSRGANIIWTNTSSGSWSAATNWNPNSVPGATDTAIIANAGVTVSLSTATGVGAIILGTNSGSTVTLSLNSQALTLYGPLTVNPSGSFTVDSGSLAGSTNAVLTGTIGWAAGTLGGVLTLAAGSTFNITTGNNHDLPGCAFTNNGTVAWNNGAIRGGSGALIVNNGLWDCQSDQQFNNAFGGAGATFNNYGTLRKSGGAGEFVNNTIFENGIVFNQLSGVIDVQNGTNGLQLAFLGGGSLLGGYVTTNAEGLLNLAGGNFNLNGLVTDTNTWLNSANLSGTNNVIQGALTWVAGNWNPSYFVTIATNSTLLVAGGGNNLDFNGVIVTNYGIVKWSSGTLRSGNAGAIYNYGLFDCQSDQQLNNAFGGAGTTFNNYGTLRKSGGASEFSTATIFAGGVLLNQLAGVIDVQNGTNGLELALEGGGNLTGGYVTTNQFGLTVLGNGQVYNLNGTVTGTNTWLQGNLAGTNVIKSGLTWVSGNWNPSYFVTIATNSLLIVNGGAGNNMDFNGVIVTNNGTVLWASGILRSGNGGTVDNYGTWNCQTDQTVNNAYGGSGTIFNNYGTFIKSGNTGTTLIDAGVAFNNSGAVNVLSGTLDFNGGGTSTGGSYSEASGAFIDFNNVTFATSTTIVGTNLVTLSGTFTVNGVLTGQNMQFVSGTLGGSPVISGALTWSGGVLSGTMTIATNSSLFIAGGGNNLDFNGVIVTNNGTVAWSSGTLRSGNGGAIYNYGLWDCQSDQTINQAYGGAVVTFNNYGTLRKSGGTGFSTTTVFAGNVFFNQVAGVIDVQNGTNGLQLTLQGGGNLNGGYITTNQLGFTVLSIGTFNINGTVTGTNTWDDAGNLAGTNVIKGALTWVNGDWSPSYFVTITTNSTLLIVGGGNNMNFNGVIITNNGTVRWSSGTLRSGNAGGIYNYGLFDCQSDQAYNQAYGGAAAFFSNYGILRKSGGNGYAVTTLFAGGVVLNQLAGVIDVQNGTNGLQLTLQGGGNLNGGYITTNQLGFTVLSLGNFNIDGTVTGTNTWEDTGNLVGTNVIHGALTWVGGSWTPAHSVTIAANCTLLMIGSGNNMTMYGVLVTNYGTFNWNSGYPDGGGTPATQIYNYGLWDCQSDYNFKDDDGGTGTIINNYGTFRKSAGTNTSQTLIQGGVLFNQLAGAVDVRQGNLTLQGGGNFTGGMATNNNGALYLNYGSFNINGTLTGTNVIENNSGNLVGNNVIQGALQWWAGQWSPATSVTIANNSTVNIAGGSGNMYMYALPVTNYGTIAWSSGYPDGGGNPATQIYNYGLWDCQGDYNFKDDAGGAGTIVNNFGTFRKSAGTNTSQTLIQGGVLFNQLAGAVDVQQGNLTLQGGGNFTGGTATNNNGALYLNYGSFNINGTLTGTNVIENNSGNLAGNNVIQGALQWWAGSWNPATSVTISSNSTVNIAGGSGNMYMYALPVTNYGTIAWSSGYPDGGGNPATQIYNYGLWDCQGDYNFKDDAGGAGTIVNNYGTFRKSAGTNTSQTLIQNGVFLNNPGRVDAQAGWLTLQGGINFTNGTVNFGISSLTNYGKLSVSGAASLSGTVSANLNNGYIPINGNSFTNLYYSSFSAGFTNTVLPFADAWVTNYFPTYYVITVLNARPVFAPLATNSFVVNELTSLNITNTANDLNIPTETLTYSLVAGLPGMTVNSATGLFAWTPPQTNSPSTNMVSVAVVNNGVPPLIATNTFTVIVKEVNVPPTLPTVATQIVNELTLLTVTNSATNFNIHSTITGYSLVNPPSGMSISAAGVITWTPTQLQSPGTNLIATIVTNSNPYDLVNPQLTSTNSFTVIIKEVNVPASLPTISTQIVNELTLLTVTNSATNGNIHSTITGYALVSPLAGMSINASGIFTWTPAQAQSPGTNLVTTVVTNSNPYDLVNPQLTATNTFTVIVKEINVAPTLPTVVTQIVNELTLLTVTNTATNSDIHATLGYALTTFPAGMSISSGGIITWTPNSSQSPSTNQVTTVVTNTDPYDLVNPHLSATNTFYVVVKEVNVPPSLPTIATQIVNELTLLTVTNTATNGNVHATITGYTLVSPPAGLIISSGGVITWTPTQAESPGTNLITTIVTNSDPYDLVSPKLTATNSFTVIVKEVNQPPVLPVIGNQTLTLLQLFSMANGATEPNIHSTTGGYVLVSPPAGAGINASGLITWTPATSQTLTTNTITTIVTNSNPYDLVNPHLSVTNSFLAVVVPNTSRTNITALNLNGTSLDLSWPADHTGWRLQNQTNTLAKGLGTNWTAVSGSSTTNHLVIPVTRTNGVVVFRMIYP